MTKEASRTTSPRLPFIVHLSSLDSLRLHARIRDEALVTSPRRPRPHTGKTSITLYLSPAQNAAAGTLVTKVMPRLTIGMDHTASVNVPLQSIPPLADGNYYIVATVTDPAGQITTAASSSPTDVSAPFVSLSEMFSGSTLGTSLVSGTRTRAVATLLIKSVSMCCVCCRDSRLQTSYVRL